MSQIHLRHRVVPRHILLQLLQQMAVVKQIRLQLQSMGYPLRMLVQIKPFVMEGVLPWGEVLQDQMELRISGTMQVL